jgi:ferredoxin
MANTVKITYVEGDGTETTVDAEIGKNLMDVAHDNNIELEGASFFNG